VVTPEQWREFVARSVAVVDAVLSGETRMSPGVAVRCIWCSGSVAVVATDDRQHVDCGQCGGQMVVEDSLGIPLFLPLVAGPARRRRLMVR
jgi:hypothetical protein